MTVGTHRCSRKPLQSVVGTLLTALLVLTCNIGTSSAQTLGDYDLHMRVDAPGVVSIIFRIPAQFPDPSQLVTIGFHCERGSATLDASRTFGDGVAQFPVARDFIEANPEFTFDGVSLVIQEYGVRCSDGNRLTFFGPVFSDAVQLLYGPSWDNTGVGTTFMPSSLMRVLGMRSGIAYAFEFEDQSGYRYPNIREGFFVYSVYVHATDSLVGASADLESRRDYVVTLTQGGVLLPLLFEAESYAQGYDASQPALISVSRGDGHGGTWDKLEIDYLGGSFTWWRDAEAPR